MKKNRCVLALFLVGGLLLTSCDQLRHFLLPETYSSEITPVDQPPLSTVPEVKVDSLPPERELPPSLAFHRNGVPVTRVEVGIVRPLELEVVGGSGRFDIESDPARLLTTRLSRRKLRLKASYHDSLMGETLRLVLRDRADSSLCASLEVRVVRVSFDWVDIPAGEFTMGTPGDEELADTDDDEQPYHLVVMSAFQMCRYEVTFAQFDAYCEAVGRELPKDSDYGRGKRPVINVSWHDAQDFCQWAGVELPTEAQWEYACRAGTSTKYSCGDTLTERYANFGETARTPREVGQFAPNPWGLYDMHGNVWEWCKDWYDLNYYYDLLDGVRDPAGPDEGTLRVDRGGSYFFASPYCRSAGRNYNDPDNYDDFHGFRVVRNFKD